MSCLLCRGYNCWRDELYTPSCVCPNPQWRFPMWKSCVDDLVEIFLCEGGDVELGARTSKHIFVFVFDPLTLTLSYLPCIDSYCSYHTYMLGIVCVSYLCSTKITLHSISTLIWMNFEEIVQSPSPGIRLHSLITLSVLQFIFNSALFVIRLAILLFTPL